jgi:hypothetical protein
MRKLSLTKTLALLACAFFAIEASGQAIRDIRINEIQVYNTDGLEDDYGHRVGWIELFNTGYSQVDVGSACLRVDGATYRIPQGDKRTVIEPQGYMIFFAEGTAAKGTFHTNFTLDGTEFVEFLDQSGEEVIDRIDYKLVDMVDNISYGWFEDYDGELKLMNLPVTTPMATNDTLEKKPRSEIFRESDPYGVVAALTAMSVVFSALVILFILFMLTGLTFKKLAAMRETKARNAAMPVEAPPIKVKAKDDTITGDELAAIALALYQYSEDLHDIENTVLTINRGAKAYSPWSSKIYGLRQLPNKK